MTDQSLFFVTKAQARKYGKSRRQSLLAPVREAAEKSLNTHLFKAVSTLNPTSLTSFMPFGDEPDIGLFNQWAALNRDLFLPRVLPKTRQLAWVQVSSIKPEVFSQSSYGILEPVGKPETDLSVIDLVILPCLCFDAQGHRVGYGGGYYDRFYEQLTQGLKRPHFLLVAFSVQKVVQVPYSPHDLVLDSCIDEQGWHQF